MSEFEDTPAVADAEPLVPEVKKNPTEFLKQVIGKPVIVKLNSGVTYKGVLACLDGYMNIAMEQTEEYIEGQLKNRYGDCFIRGNNGKLRKVDSSQFAHTYSSVPTFHKFYTSVRLKERSSISRSTVRYRRVYVEDVRIRLSYDRGNPK